jgi:hypothetical protein
MMTTLDKATWRTASRSTLKGGDCVEVADLTDGVWAVRDSKDRTGPALVIPRHQWAAFTAGVRADQFDQ